MRVLIAADKFKGSLTANEACRAIAQGVQQFSPAAKTTLLPLADGGEGSLQVLASVLSFKKIELTVTGPLFKPVKAYYGLLGNTAYIEMAEASGLLLLDEKERHAPSTTTLGTGELIADALKRGATTVYLFIGGSATNDAGIGMAHALGYRFFNAENKTLPPTGASLSHIRKITGNLAIPTKNARFFVVTDVQNPLFGKNGAAKVYAAQKGANEKEVAQLDYGLQQFNRLASTIFGKDVSQEPGAGAAGGLGAGAMLFLDAKVKPGVETMMDILGFDKMAKSANMIITGEGKVDAQTLAGKVVKGVVDRVRSLNKPVGVVSGAMSLSSEQKKTLGTSNIYPILTDSVTLQEAMANAYDLLVQRTTELMEEMKLPGL